jgi:protein TonB
METKKNSVHNLEKSFSLRLFAGLAIALSMTLVAFEWRTPFEKEIACSFPPDEPGIIIDIIPITVVDPEKPKQPEVPKLQPKVIIPTEQINVVTNTTITPTDDIFFADADSASLSVPTPPVIPDLPTDKRDPELPWNWVEKMPRFKCSDDEHLLAKHLAAHIKYPKIAREMGITGTAYIEFIVSREGKVTNVRVSRGFDKHCDAEALRVVNELPDFCPGMQGGTEVPVIHTVPIRFALQ